MEEQLELARADLAGEHLEKMKRVYVTDDSGQRVAKQMAKKLRRWYWKNLDGSWFLELRYGNKAIDLSKGRYAIEVGSKEKLGDIIEEAMAAVRAGELDRALMVAQAERLGAVE